MKRIGWPITWEPPLGGESLPFVLVDVKDAQLKIWYDITEAGIVFRSIEGADLTATQLNALLIGELRTHLQARLREDPDRLLGLALFAKLIEEGNGAATPRELEVMRASRIAARIAVEPLATAGPKQGRGADHDFYREIAQEYIATLETHGQHIIKAMTEKRDVPRDTVATWVRRSRELGWLEKRNDKDSLGQHKWRGRAYGGPGPRLLKWLEEEERNS